MTASNDGINLELTYKFISQIGEVKKNPIVKSVTGKPIPVDAVVSTKDQTYAVFTYNWKRPVGINKVHQIERILKNSFLDGAILISHKFSLNAEELASKIVSSSDQKILLIQNEELKYLAE